MTELESQSLITFSLGEELFAVNVDFLIEVLEPITVSPLPLVPPFVEGLVNIGGEIIPLVDLVQFVYPEKEPSENLLETLLVIELSGVQFALKVNEIQETIEFQKTEVADTTLAEDGTLLVEVFEYEGRKIHVFNPEALARVVRSQTPDTGEEEPSFLGEREEKKHEEERFREFLIVDASGSEYALELPCIYDVVDISSIHSQSGAPDAMLGVALVREKPRLILNLPELLGMDEDFSLEGGQITAVMIDFKSVIYGFAVHNIIGLEQISESQITFDPDGQMLSVIRGENQSVVEVVSIDEVIDSQLVKELKPFTPDVQEVEVARVSHVDLLRFMVDQSMYAINISDVKRIIYNKKIEPLLDSQGYLLGTIEFEGNVIPVVDLPSQLSAECNGANFEYYAQQSHNEFIVVTVNGSDWAFSIGRSDEIVSIPEAAVDQVRAKSGFITAFTQVNEQLLSVLNISTICKANTLSQILNSGEV